MLSIVAAALIALPPPAVEDNDPAHDAVCAWTRGTLAQSYGNGTLVAPDKVLIAGHLLWANVETMNPDTYPWKCVFVGPDGAPMEIRVTEVDLLGERTNPDLALVTLETPIEHIPPMPIWDGALDEDPTRPLRIVAHGSASCTTLTGSGVRRVRVLEEGARGVWDTFILLPQCVVTDRDSGAAVMVRQCGQLYLVGVASTAMSAVPVSAVRDVDDAGVVPASMPPMMRADVNGDGAVDDADFFTLVGTTFSDTPDDYNGDGFENEQDWFDFVNDFFACWGR